MMKKIFILLSIFICFCLTGCIKRDTMEDITINTSVYPIEYITNRLYGEHSKISSIYPDGVITDLYTLNDKQIKDYSKSDLFIFNGLSEEKSYLTSMLKFNNDLKIIDATLSMEYNSYQEELWLDPSNALMLARNIKAGLNEYINNHYLKNEIEKNYDDLKLDLSTLSAKLNVISSSSYNPTIVVSSDMFKFLEKYGFSVISLDEKSVTDKAIADVKRKIDSGEVKHIFVIDDVDNSPVVQGIIDETGVQTLAFHPLSSLSDNERTSKKDYMSLSFENINLLKQELYR
ncbi:MAG: metal ABC transporter substrate-binding protein [Bacilli bacterium]